jgi:GNAT superfamily N-acetyltransferase
MGWWRSSRHATIAARVATVSDRPAISALVANAWWRHGTPALEDQVALLHKGVSIVAFVRDQCIGMLGFSLRDPAGEPIEKWADLASVALSGGRAPAKTLKTLLEAAFGELRARDVTGLVCLTNESWLRAALSEVRFTELDRVVGYARSTRSLPLPVAASPANVRQARARDGDVVLALNSASFAPIWRYDSSTILSWLITADHAVLAEAGEEPAGFALTTGSRDSEFAQLVRVATAPRFQGRGIGRQLVVDAIHYASGIGASGLSLNTQASNAISRHLYEGLGFRLTGHTVGVMVYKP